MQQTTKELTLFIFLYALSRLFCLLIPGQFYDFYEDAQYGNALLSSENIYQAFGVTSQGTAVLKYPPLYYPLLTLMMLVFGHYDWSIRCGFTLWEIGILYVLFRFTSAINKNRINSKREDSIINKFSVLYLYAFSPVTILNLIFGQPWFLGVFFLVLGTYTFYLHRPIVTGLIFCIGFLTQLYPAFMLFPIITYYACKKLWRDVTKLICIFIIAFVFLCLPFFFLNPDLFLFNFFTHLSRIPQTISLWDFFWSGTLPTFSLFGIISISLLGFISIFFTGIYIIFLLIGFKLKKDATEETVIWVSFIYYLALPLIFLSIDFRYYYWMFPLLTLIFGNKASKKQLINLSIMSLSLISGLGLLYLIKMPDSLTINQLVYPNLIEIYSILLLMMEFFLWALPFYTIAWYHYGKSFFIINENQAPNLFQSLTIIISIFVFQVGISYFQGDPLLILIYFITSIVSLLLLLRPIGKIYQFAFSITKLFPGRNRKKSSEFFKKK